MTDFGADFGALATTHYAEACNNVKSEYRTQEAELGGIAERIRNFNWQIVQRMRRLESVRAWHELAPAKLSEEQLQEISRAISQEAADIKKNRFELNAMCDLHQRTWNEINRLQVI